MVASVAKPSHLPKGGGPTLEAELAVTPLWQEGQLTIPLGTDRCMHVELHSHKGLASRGFEAACGARKRTQTKSGMRSCEPP